MRGGLLLLSLPLEPLLLLEDPDEVLLLLAEARRRGGDRVGLRPRCACLGSPSSPLTPAGWYRSGASASAR